MEQQLIDLHTRLGNHGFLTVVALISILLSVKLIPATTDMMVNSAAGLAGKYLGRQHRTLVINCSTNNPEVVTMLLAFFFGHLGGIGTPLGSNFANIYLMFGIALAWVLISFRVRNPAAFRDLWALLRKERKLVAWHVLMSVGMFLIAAISFRWLTGQFPIGPPHHDAEPFNPGIRGILSAAALCCVGITVFAWRDMALRRKRPDLYDEIDESDHTASWTVFGVGTLGLLVACWLINVLFVVVTTLYKGQLQLVLGDSVFALLHYFVGALVTSLPEMNVAIKNYRRMTTPDLNTALASATASNMSNLAIAAIGCLIASTLLALGFHLKP